MRSLCLLVCAAVALLAAPAGAGTLKCAADAVKVGNVCMDKYEASVWQVPNNVSLIKKVQAGKATLADLNAAGAVQLGCNFPPFFTLTDYPLAFPDDGQWTPVGVFDPPSPGVYAASVAGVLPSTCITWFQAAQACALSGKHLATNREWQDAAAGTPAGACVTSGFPASTGAHPGCVSRWGAVDMVGNTSEWVADWVPASTSCPGWGGFSDDAMCLSGASTTSNGPGALIRGGNFAEGTFAGVFTVTGSLNPSNGSGVPVGFRCAR